MCVNKIIMDKRNSKKVIYLSVLGVLLAGLAVYLNVFVFNEEKEIDRAIEEAKYCEKKDDCAKIESQCPFGCWVVVNKNETERIRNMIHSYESYCAYGCTEPEGYDCIENKCQILY